MGTEIEIDDYVIAKVKTSFLLLKVVSLNEDEIVGLPEKHCLNSDKYVDLTLPIESIILNLGDNPAFGTAYGCSIEPYRYTDENAKLGNIHFFRDLESNELKKLMNAFKFVYKRLKRTGLTKVFPLEIEIRNSKGKYAGFYKLEKKDGLDMVCLKPEEIDSAYLAEIFSHEVGHAVWFRLVPDRLKLKWINYYHKHVKLQQTSKRDLSDLLSLINVSDCDSIKEFKFSLEEDKKVVFASCIDYMADIHNLGIDDLNVVLTQRKGFNKLWPDRLHMSDMDDILTEYSRKSVAELFAESFRVMVMAGKLPKDLSKLMSLTLQKAANTKV